MAFSTDPASPLVKELAALLVSVAGESVSMVKRSLPEQALKLKQRREWEIYLEFLKLLYDLADRLSAYHVPLAEQPQFMQALEQTITAQLSTVLELAVGPEADEMEVMFTISRAVAEGRRLYERFRFDVSQESEAKDQYLRAFSQRIARLMDAPENGMVLSAATLCATAAIPAITAALTGSEQTAPTSSPANEGTAGRSAGSGGNEIKLLSVMSTIDGEEVETRWGLHPRFSQDLTPEQVQDLTRSMNRVTQILGHRYAAVAFSTEWSRWNRMGHA